MKKVFAMMSLGFVGAAFGLDEYLSIEKGKLEVDAGYFYSNTSQVYNDNGKAGDYPGDLDLSFHQFPLQLKYGITDGLDVELWTTGLISNEDAGDLGGFTNPQLALKYTHAPIHAGAFVNLTMPFVTGNLDKNGDPAMALSFGAVYGNRFGDFRLTGITSYQINFENEDEVTDRNSFLIYAKPEAMWTEFIGTYLGLQYTLYGKSENAFGTVENDGYLFAVVPGANVQLLNWLAYEVYAPFSLMGKNNPSLWGIGASVYVTLPR